MEQHLFTCDNPDCQSEQRDPGDWFTVRDYLYYNERMLVVARLNLRKSAKEGELHVCSAACALKIVGTRLNQAWDKKTPRVKKGAHAAP